MYYAHTYTQAYTHAHTYIHTHARAHTHTIRIIKHITVGALLMVSY